MKKHMIAIAIATLGLVACDNKRSGDEATVSDEQKTANASGAEMYLDTSGSLVAFTGWGVGKNHPGRFKFNSGSMTVKDGELTSGTFTIRIESITMDEPGEMFQNKLRGHLVSADFFDSKVYPEAKFEITKVEPYVETATDTSVVAGANKRISGNLTLHGVTKNVSFPAKVDIEDNSVSAQANFDIDRTQWNMNYNADKESMKDKFIAHEVNIRLDVKARTAEK